jgi:hypothetical protein
MKTFKITPEIDKNPKKTSGDLEGPIDDKFTA